MFKFDIKIKRADYRRVKSALTRQITVARQEERELPYRCAVSFKDLVFEKILSGNLSHPSYNPDYAKFKRRFGDKGFWRLHDNILQSLTVFKSEDGEGWMGGIPAGRQVTRVSMLAGGKNKSVFVADYARTLEYGIGIQKDRPVFVPTTQEYLKNNFPEEIEKSVKKLKKAWR